MPNPGGGLNQSQEGAKALTPSPPEINVGIGGLDHWTAWTTGLTFDFKFNRQYCEGNVCVGVDRRTGNLECTCTLVLKQDLT